MSLFGHCQLTSSFFSILMAFCVVLWLTGLISAVSVSMILELPIRTRCAANGLIAEEKCLIQIHICYFNKNAWLKHHVRKRVLLQYKIPVKFLHLRLSVLQCFYLFVEFCFQILNWHLNFIYLLPVFSWTSLGWLFHLSLLSKYIELFFVCSLNSLNSAFLLIS